ncbi:MAG: hypothetical protein WDN28_00175 [Chthoniobacter sp.]
MTAALEGLTDYDIQATVVLRPDKRARCFAHYIPNWLYQETVGLETDADHLLKTTENTFTDKTKESLSNLAEAFANGFQAFDGFATLGRGGFFRNMAPAGTPREISTPTVAVRKVNLDVTFDPADSAARKRIEGLFNPVNGGHWKLGGVELISPFQIDLESLDDDEKEVALPHDHPNSHGIWFRAPKTYRIKVISNLPLIMSKFKDAKELPPEVAIALGKQFNIRDSNLTLAIPDPKRPFEWNVTRSAFIQKKTKLLISQGALQGFSVDKGSEVEGFTLIPLELAKIAAGIPKSLVQNRSDLTTGLNTLNANQQNLDNSAALDKQARLKAEADALDQEIATRQKRAELKKLIKDENAAPSATPTP